MEPKVKEEAIEPTTNNDKRKATNGKDRRSPEQDESRCSPVPVPGPISPQNGTTESLSPPLDRSAPTLHRLRKFLSALYQFATDIGSDTGDRVKQHIFSLVSGTMTIEDFQSGVQESTNYPLRPSVPGFLRALLPIVQRDIIARARTAKQSPIQYIRSHEQLILESCGDSSEIFGPHHAGLLDPGLKRRASDP